MISAVENKSFPCLCLFVSGALLLNLGATSKQAFELLLIICYVSLHDIHAGAQQPLEGFHIHDLKEKKKGKVKHFICAESSNINMSDVREILK